MNNDLRQQVLDARFKLPAGERRAKSRQIENKLFSLSEFRAARVILFYASFRSEVETWEMIRRALVEGKRVVLPRVKGKELVLFEIGDFDEDVKPGTWDIPEPAQGRPASISEIDLIVVPGSVFDEQGNRMGYGGGFYDRLLPSFTGPTVALAFELQIVDSVPVGPHDVPVGKIVTERRIITAEHAEGAEKR